MDACMIFLLLFRRHGIVTYAIVTIAYHFFRVLADRDFIFLGTGAVDVRATGVWLHE